MYYRKKSVSRNFLILASPSCYPRRKHMVLQDFLQGKLGLLYVADWFKLYNLFSATRVRREIRACVRANIQQGNVMGMDKAHIDPYKKFIGRVFS